MFQSFVTSGKGWNDIALLKECTIGRQAATMNIAPLRGVVRVLLASELLPRQNTDDAVFKPPIERHDQVAILHPQ